MRMKANILSQHQKSPNSQKKIIKKKLFQKLARESM